MNLVHNDLSPTRPAFRPDMAPVAAVPAIEGEAACVHAFDRLCKLRTGWWETLPVCGSEPARRFTAVLDAALGAPTAKFPYAAIAAEAGRPFERGLRGATPLALILLAAMALGRGGADEEAHTLARTALAMAARLGARTLRMAEALHAALVAPYAGALEQAVAGLAALCEQEPGTASLHLCLGANGFMAGTPLPELSQHLRRAAGLPAPGALAAELVVRADLLDGLVQQRDAAARCAQGPGEDTLDASRFGTWTLRLQAAVYRDDTTRACYAAGRAEALAGPLLPAGDRVAYHLFAALAWAQSDDVQAGARLDQHCAAARRLARQLSACALAQCVEAVRACHAGDRLGALRGFDGAGTEAKRQGRHGLASLAWEQAAAQAQACGLGAAVQHYRREALASCERWGAAGRAAVLRQAWGEDADARAERERILHAGRVGELGLSIAHEVNQPLAAISLHAAAARKWLRRNEPDVERALTSLSLISEAGQHAGDIVRSVQRLASHKEQEMGSVRVDQTIVDTLRLLHRPLRKHGIEVQLALGLDDCSIHASRVQLQQVLTNLLVNATEALAGSAASDTPRRIHVQSHRYGEHEIEIAVTDNGPGIAPEHAGRVFGSLFSTKPNSTGMGLSISLAIVRAHGGHIAYEPCAPHGACFRFRLPVQSSHP